MSVAISISGAGGRMGRRLLALADADPDFAIVQALEGRAFPLLGQPVNALEKIVAKPGNNVRLAEKLAPGARVLLDFSVPEATMAHLAAAVSYGTAMLIGTTGLDARQKGLILEASGKIAVLQAPNFSLGVNLLFRIAGEVAKALGDGYDVEIVEAHHNQKIDAPSGTALGIARAVTEALGRDPDRDLVHGRSGKPGKRTVREIGMHALRMGSVVGDHTVCFGSPFERIELTHRADSRDAFAAGALRAAKWLADKPAGFYTMENVLFG